MSDTEIILGCVGCHLPGELQGVAEHSKKAAVHGGAVATVITALEGAKDLSDKIAPPEKSEEARTRSRDNQSTLPWMMVGPRRSDSDQPQ